MDSSAPEKSLFKDLLTFVVLYSFLAGFVISALTGVAVALMFFI